MEYVLVLCLVAVLSLVIYIDHVDTRNANREWEEIEAGEREFKAIVNAENRPAKPSGFVQTVGYSPRPAVVVSVPWAELKRREDVKRGNTYVSKAAPARAVGRAPKAPHVRTGGFHGHVSGQETYEYEGDADSLQTALAVAALNNSVGYHADPSPAAPYYNNAPEVITFDPPAPAPTYSAPEPSYSPPSSSYDSGSSSSYDSGSSSSGSCDSGSSSSGGGSCDF